MTEVSSVWPPRRDAGASTSGGGHRPARDPRPERLDPGQGAAPSALCAALRDGVVMTDLLLALDPVDLPIADFERFGIRSGAGDMLVRPEPETLRELSWRPGWGVCLGTPAWRDGRPCELASREVLRSVLADAAQLGYEVKAAFEYEVRPGRGREPALVGNQLQPRRGRALRRPAHPPGPALDGLGLMAVHTEAGPRLLELNVAARPGLQAADDATFLKLAVKDVAASLGLTASFLAKTAAGEEGSSGHVHLSCWSDGENAFASDPAGNLPAPLAGAVAGVLDRLPAASLLLNPTINSYKRLVPGYFAPVNASWGIENRSAAVRVIRSEPAHCRIECRRPGADANPYLALAALVASALDGIRRKAEPPAPVEGDASERSDLPPLPGSLESAIAAFGADEVLRGALGEGTSASTTWSHVPGS